MLLINSKMSASESSLISIVNKSNIFIIPFSAAIYPPRRKKFNLKLSIKELPRRA